MVRATGLDLILRLHLRSCAIIMCSQLKLSYENVFQYFNGFYFLSMGGIEIISVILDTISHSSNLRNECPIILVEMWAPIHLSESEEWNLNDSWRSWQRRFIRWLKFDKFSLHCKIDDVAGSTKGIKRLKRECTSKWCHHGDLNKFSAWPATSRLLNSHLELSILSMWMWPNAV